MWSCRKRMGGSEGEGERVRGGMNGVSKVTEGVSFGCITPFGLDHEDCSG